MGLLGGDAVDEIGDSEAVCLDVVAGDLAEVYLGGLDVGVSHGVGDVGEAESGAVGEGCPCVAGDV